MGEKKSVVHLLENLKKDNIYFVDYMEVEVGETPSILCPAFAEFKNNHQSNDPLTDQDRLIASLYSAEKSNILMFRDEETKFTAAFKTFLENAITQLNYPFLVSTQQVASKTNPNIKSDLSVSKENSNHWEIPLILEEDKKIQGSTNSEPDIQVASYYAHHFHAQRDADGTISSGGCPTFLITHVGNNIKIMGAYTIQRNSKLYHLIETLMTGQLTQNVNQTAKIFSALFRATNELQKFRETVPSIRYPSAHFSLEDDCDGFAMYPRKLVYLGTSVIHKYAKTYCKQAHEKAHSLGIAPKLNSCELLPCGYYVVSMERIVILSDIDSENWLNHWEFFEKQMKQFNTDFVHGDLREDNVVYSKGGFMLLDFDWSGPINEEPRYPINRNHVDIDWPEDSSPGGIITPSHDEHMLNLLKQHFQQSIISR